MKVLGIETSCDETGVAIYDTDQGLLAHQLYSQVKQHAVHGGVVPELASRDHIRRLSPLTQACLDEAGLVGTDIDAVAYTAGPGLIGALLSGTMYARSLAWGWQVPCLGINHLEAHVLAPMLEDEKPEFPFLALLVSGGHSLLINVNSLGEYEILGETLDDAAGEAFDKTAKLLGFEYPGGPRLAKLAEQGREGIYTFPRPMTNRPGLDFSFSGLKTHTLTTWQQSPQDEQTKADIALAFQTAVVETFIIKCRRALDQTGAKRLVIAGGVGANQALRAGLAKLMQARQGELYFPRLSFCTDNGAMVAYAGAMRLLRGEQDHGHVPVRARWPLTGD